MKRHLVVFSLLICDWLFVHQTKASADEFDSPAAACVPAETAIQNDRYLVTGGTVKHNGTNVDLITLYCPVAPKLSTSPSHLYLMYKDTNTLNTTYVTASYIKMSKATGSITTVKTASSEDGVENANVNYVELGFTDTYDPSNYIYYIRVDLDRATTSDTAIFYATNLW